METQLAAESRREEADCRKRKEYADCREQKEHTYCREQKEHSGRRGSRLAEPIPLGWVTEDQRYVAWKPQQWPCGVMDERR